MKGLLAHTFDIGHKFYPILQEFLAGKIYKEDALELIDHIWPKLAKTEEGRITPLGAIEKDGPWTHLYEKKDQNHN